MKKNIFEGKWKIYELGDGNWDDDYINMEEPGYIEFDDKIKGDFHFGLVYAYLIYEIEDDEVQFTFDGSDELDHVFGRGFAELIDKELHGYIVFHGGERMTFKASKKAKKARKK